MTYRLGFSLTAALSVVACSSAATPAVKTPAPPADVELEVYMSAVYVNAECTEQAPCQHVSMNLKVKDRHTGAETSADIVGVEVLDEGGVVVNELTQQLQGAVTFSNIIAEEVWDSRGLDVNVDNLDVSKLSNWKPIPATRYGGGDGLAVRVTIEFNNKRLVQMATPVAP